MMVKRTISYSKGCKTKSVAKYKEGGGIGGIGGGYGVDGSGNRGNGGFGGGTSGNQGGGGLGGGGKGGIGGTGVRSGTTSGTTMKSSSMSMGAGKPRPTSAPAPKAPKMSTMPAKPTPPKPTLRPQQYFSAIGGSGVQAYKGGPAAKPINRQGYKNNVVGGRGSPGYGGSNLGMKGLKK